jgi:predicted O-methyltransferase YrrM
MSKLFQLQSYITYWLDQVDERSLHSPFFYDLYTNVIQKKESSSLGESLIEALRARLLQTDMIIEVEDFGSGAVLKSNKRNVKDIARTSLSPQHYSSLYARLIERFKCKTIVELGTSLGINTLYLAGPPGVTVYTFEGSPKIASIAKSTFDFAGATNIRLIEGNIKATLGSFAGSAPKLDFIFIDAHHELSATLDYFNVLLPRVHHGTLILVDDIHYNPGMSEAWSTLKRHPLVYGSIDLFRVGILLFDPSLNKQHVVLQFRTLN